MSESPLDRLLVRDPNDKGAFKAAVHEVLARPDFYRQLVLEHARPLVELWMAPENWWRRFLEIAGLTVTH